jgi:uncharacterized membrane protein YhaH (DUF805 family)
MSFQEAVKTVLTKYVDFNGRARRSEYWYFVLFNLLVNFVVGIVVNLTGLTFLSYIVSLALLLPGLGVCVRRLHDIGKGWAWILLALIPLVGAIILIVFYCQDSQPGDNQYGPNPKGNTGFNM